MSNEKTGAAASASRALESTDTNPLDFVPDKIPFDIPYGPPISLDRAQTVIHAAVAEAKKRNWKMNVAVVDSGGNLVAFQRMDGAMLASIQIAKHKARAAATFRRETKQFEDGIQLMHLNYLLAFDGIIASRKAGGFISVGVRSAGTLDAVTVLRVSMHQSMRRQKGIRSLPVSSRVRIGSTITRSGG
jgi:glc operon protein GlcG